MPLSATGHNAGTGEVTFTELGPDGMVATASDVRFSNGVTIPGSLKNTR